MMAKMYSKPTIETDIVLVISEAEARALAELASYNVGEVIDAIQKQISSSLIKRHDTALTQFLKTVRSEVSGPLERIEEARKVFRGTHLAEPNSKIATQQEHMPVDQGLPNFSVPRELR